MAAVVETCQSGEVDDAACHWLVHSRAAPQLVARDRVCTAISKVWQSSALVGQVLQKCSGRRTRLPSPRKL